MQYRARYFAGTLRLETNTLPQLAEGEPVTVEIERGRSDATHRHQFAWVNDAWATLPETVAWEPWAQTPEMLRKHALIMTGFYQQEVIDCGDGKVAKDVATKLKAAHSKGHGYALAIVRDGVAVVRYPESQSRKAMGAKRFQESKTAILEWIAAQIGVEPRQLMRNAS
ncbi:hypothetical protein [Thioclava sp. DLFJ4-1]|uniref:hypothetical protein n=1 Tax=Thioclava sp. DLFJ4-1 TaxID=1915313 RepID=UPI000998D962|nr:hypothetical protein [Thioclava sp. DLFJ4-1]OOY15103.1 hypothetical protein BMI85_16280 [Thioclava sp. DLFJ4-1]